MTSSSKRICRTVEEAFRAGWDDGAEDPPLTDRQCQQVAMLLGPYVRPIHEAA